MFTRIILLLSALTLVQTCKSRSSELKHDLNQPVRSKGRWQWTAVSRDEFINVVAKANNINNPKLFLPANDPLAVRMDYWVKAIHKNLSGVEEVPVPETIVLKNDEANAFVSPVQICLDIPVRFNPDMKDGEGNRVKYVSLSTDSELESADDEPLCIKKTLERKYLDEIVTWFNANSENCKLHFDKDPATGGGDILVASSNCRMSPVLEDKTFAEKLVITGTANWVTIHTGLISFFKKTEAKILQTIAHELGHYYRSHLTTFPKDYNFFYKLADATNKRPVPNPALKEMGRKVFEGSRYVQLAKVPNQDWHSALFPVARDVIDLYCNGHKDNCKAASPCEPTFSFLKSEEFDDALSDFPEKPIRDEAPKVSIYKKFEAMFPKCALNIPMVDTSRSQKSMTRNRLLKVLRENDLSTIFSPEFDKSKNVLEVLASLNVKAQEAYDSSIFLLRETYNNKIGYYTAEQEADEFGFEQVISLGYDPQMVLTSELEFYAEDEDEERVDPVLMGFSSEKCLDLYTAPKTWNDANGNYVIPPIADFFDEHHTGCYRVYNLDREVKLHDYKKADKPKIAAPAAPSWDGEIVPLAQNYNSEVRKNESAKLLAKKKIRRNFRSCPSLRRTKSK